MAAETSVFLFLCDSTTRHDVIKLQLVGTTWDQWNKHFHSLKHDDAVLIYDYDSFEIIGPYRVVASGANIGKPSWAAKFPAQASLTPVGSIQTLSFDEVVQNVSEFGRLSPTGKPRPCFTGSSAESLLQLFGVQSGTASPQLKDPISRTPTTQSGVRYRTAQGFDVKSKAERAVAQLLYIWNLACYYERPAPPANRFLCDFYLPKHDLYIEYWGTPNDAAYRDRMNEKRDSYARNGLKLLELFPEDEENLELRLAQKLSNFGIETKRPTRSSRFGWLWAWVLRMLGWR